MIDRKQISKNHYQKYKERERQRRYEYYLENKHLWSKYRQTSDSRYKRKYGLNPGDYEILLKKQGGVCAICKKKCSIKKKLCVDHCHQDGRVRGLLCSKCNQALGLFQDLTDNLRGAISYLEKSYDENHMGRS